MLIDSSAGGGSRITLVSKGPAPGATPEAGARAGLPARETAGLGRRIRLVIADDHEIVRQGLRSLLRGEPDMEIVAEAADGQEAVDLARKLRPDVVVMDVSMPRMNGCDATRVIAAEFPDVRVVGLSMHDEPELCSAMLKAGAAAYVTKDGPTDSLIAAIRMPAGQPIATKSLTAR